MRFTHSDVWGTISYRPKSITGLRRGIEKRRSSRELQRSTFARFLGLFDFRLLQQYLPGTDSRFTHCGPTTCLAKVIARAQVWAGCSTLSSHSASSPRADSSEISSVAVVGLVLRL